MLGRREKCSINLRLYLTSLCLVIVHGLHRTQVITQEVLYETKPRLSITITHEAITLCTKSKYKLCVEFISESPCKIEAFTAINKKTSSILVQTYTDNVRPTLTTWIPMNQNNNFFFNNTLESLLPIAGHLYIEITQVKQVTVSACEEEDNSVSMYSVTD